MAEPAKDGRLRPSRGRAWQSECAQPANRFRAAVANGGPINTDKENTAAADGSRWQLGNSPRDYFRCATTPAGEFQGTIVDAALATPDLKSLADAVVAAGLVGTLNGRGPFTVFAPTNAAFGKIPPAVLASITSDASLLTAVLKYHVVPGNGHLFDARQPFGAPRELATVQGQTVFLNRNKSAPQVNQSNVSCQPVKTNNGTVYIVDGFLLPQF
jgi:uncharacterized surface protein with fasciclin (FAS1) repeats